MNFDTDKRQLEVRLQNRVRELDAATSELERLRMEIGRLRDELQAANLCVSEAQMATQQLNCRFGCVNKLF